MFSFFLSFFFFLEATDNFVKTMLLFINSSGNPTPIHVVQRFTRCLFISGVLGLEFDI